jgi:hypothetical protein
MPYDTVKSGDKWQVIDEDTGDVKGEHDTEEQANAQLAALYSNASPEEEAKKMDVPTMFIPITKIDAKLHQVWGWGAVEEDDNADEIMDYASSKPYVMNWSNQVQKRSGGKSKGNIRSMHSPIATGRLIDLKADDQRKGFFLGAEIVDEKEWEKVEKGVYTGFSIGGSYARRWADPARMGKIRYTANPKEWSLVDAPCIPSATFEMVKVDGSTETRSFQPGEGNESLVFDEDEDESLAPPTEKPVDDSLNPPVEDVDSQKNKPLEDLYAKEKSEAVESVVKLMQVLGLSKADIPGAPEEIASIPLESKIGPSFDIEHMPEPNATLALKQNIYPDQNTLAGHTVKSEDLTSAFNAWLPSVGKMIKIEVAKAVEEALNKVVPSVPAARMIKVNSNKLLVRKEQ